MFSVKCLKKWYPFTERLTATGSNGPYGSQKSSIATQQKIARHADNDRNCKCTRQKSALKVVKISRSDNNRLHAHEISPIARKVIARLKRLANNREIGLAFLVTSIVLIPRALGTEADFVSKVADDP
jgi:hypothetical protein